MLSNASGGTLLFSERIKITKICAGGGGGGGCRIFFFIFGSCFMLFPTFLKRKQKVFLGVVNFFLNLILCFLFIFLYSTSNIFRTKYFRGGVEGWSGWYFRVIFPTSWCFCQIKIKSLLCFNRALCYLLHF